MLRYALYGLLALCMTGCPSAMLGTAVLGTSIADERTIGMQIDDLAITSKIMARLTAETDMPSRWLSVDSIEGKVSLMGHLKNQEQINRAVFIAKSFQGVKNVHSEIKIGEPSLKSIATDSWITTKVKTRLLKDPKTSGIAVHVETIEGRVYLQGMVRNDAQYQRALELTSTTRGVKEVVDMLKVNAHGTDSVIGTGSKGAKGSGSRKRMGSKSKLKVKESQPIETYNHAVEPPETNVVIEEQAVTIPLSTLNQGDIFEETVSSIRHKRKPKETVRLDPYEDHSEKGPHEHDDSDDKATKATSSTPRASHRNARPDSKNALTKEKKDSSSDTYQDLRSQRNSL